MQQSILIIGAAHAGVQLAASLRDEGFEGKIQLLSEEKDAPYQKPPLSKGFLHGKQTEENLLFRNATFYENNHIELILGEKIARIDIKNNQATAQSGRIFDFETLVLATGARNRLLSIKGHDLKGIFYLRTLEDAKKIKKHFAKAKNIAVIGGGFIGLEAAAAAIELEKNVTVIENQGRLMARALPAPISDVFLKKHIENGVNVLLNTKIASLEGQRKKITGILLENGETIAADMVIVGIGVVPNEELAAEAGILCENGIVVDDFLRTSAPNIYAIGDCAKHFNPYMGKSLRLESVQNATDQAKTLATCLTGKQQPYVAVPWFWTNQYDLKLQMAGTSEGFDTYEVRGDMENNKFSIFYYKNEKLIGVDSINRPADHLAARKLLQAGALLRHI
jgi:3-phenylpropionate/trans-cinnamate dioxygenase ferredoxin reductase component